MTSITSGTNAAVAANTPVGQREVTGEVTGQSVLPSSAVGMSGGGPYVPPLVAAMNMGMHCSVNVSQASQMLMQGAPQQYHHFYQTANSTQCNNYSNVAGRSPYNNGTTQAPPQMYQCPTPQRTNTTVPVQFQAQQNGPVVISPQPQPQPQQPPTSFQRGNIPHPTSQAPYFNMQQQPPQQQQSHPEQSQQQTNTSPQTNGSVTNGGNNGYVMWPPQYSTPSTNGTVAPVPPSTVQFPSFGSNSHTTTTTTSTQPSPFGNYHTTTQSNGPISSTNVNNNITNVQVPTPQILQQQQPPPAINGEYTGLNGNGQQQQRISPALTPTPEVPSQPTSTMPPQVEEPVLASVIMKTDHNSVPVVEAEDDEEDEEEDVEPEPELEHEREMLDNGVNGEPPQVNEVAEEEVAPKQMEEDGEHPAEEPETNDNKNTETNGEVCSDQQKDGSRPASPAAATSPPPMAQSTPFQVSSTAPSALLAGNNKIPATLTFGDAIGALVTDRALSMSPSPRASPQPLHESPSGSPATSNSSSHSLALSGTPMIMPMASTTPLSPECDDCGDGGPMDCSVGGHGDNHEGGVAFPTGAQGPMTSSSSVSGSGAAAGGEDSNEGSGSGTSKFAYNSHNYEHVCQFCDYTSRTEGRLKRHIKDFHSEVPPTNYSGAVKVVRSGRPKNYRCKQCSFTATSKIEFWEHSRAHIKEDKLLQCPKCPFVTEYKHHLEYHLRNHFGSKPFKCSKCNYSCVNKSMLNSHMKSHTNIYQYRCADCSYATKYCHSLKLHLRKYDHHASNLMTADGSLVVDDKVGDQSQTGTNEPGTPSGLPLSMSLFGPGTGGDDAKMDDANGDNCEPEDGEVAGLVPNSQKPVSSAASSSSTGSGAHLENHGNGIAGAPLSRLPLPGIGSFPGLQDSPAAGAVPPGWNANDPPLANPATTAASIQSRPMPPGQMATAMSRLVSGEGNNDPAALASLMGAYYSMLGPQGVAGQPPGSMPATMCAAAVPGNNGQQTTMIKCNTCGFLAPSWPLIMQHVFKVHASEHNDLFRAFGISPDVLSDLNKCILPGQFGGSANGNAIPPAMAAMFAAGGLPPGMQLPPAMQQQIQQQTQQPTPGTNGSRRRSHAASTGSPMAVQNTTAINQFLATQGQQPPGVTRPPGSTAPWPLDLTKSGGSGSGSGSFRDSRSRSSPSLGMNGGGSGSSVSRSTDTPASSSNDAPLTGNDVADRNGLDLLCRRGGDLVGGDPSSPASGGSGSGSGSGTNGDANGRRRARKGKAVKLSAMRQGQPTSLGSGGSEGDGEGVTSGSSGTGGDAKPAKIQNGWAEQFASALGQESYAMQLQQQQQRAGSRIDDWAVQSHLDPAAAQALQQQQSRQQPQQPGDSTNGSRRQSSSNAPGSAGNASATARQSSRPNASTSSSSFECSHCEMAFRDVVMYTIHMGYHGFLDPFKCNMCGSACRDRVDFFLHIARQAHS